MERPYGALGVLQDEWPYGALGVLQDEWRYGTLGVLQDEWVEVEVKRCFEMKPSALEENSSEAECVGREFQ